MTLIFRVAGIIPMLITFLALTSTGTQAQENQNIDDSVEESVFEETSETTEESDDLSEADELDAEIDSAKDFVDTDGDIDEDIETAAEDDGDTGPEAQSNQARSKRNDRGPVQKGSRYIPHPNASKGLTKITRNKVYIYKTPRSEQTKAVSVRIGPYEPSFLESSDDAGSTFYDNYDQTDSPMVLFDYEWQWFQGALGKLGLQTGFGLYFANGNGRFANDTEGLTPRETFTLVAAPVNGGAVYRLQFFDKQPIVPFAVGGGTLIGFGEFRDDDKSPRFGGAFAAYVGGGGSINMGFLDTQSMMNLDREYGINSLFLTFEYRKLLGFSTFDFSADVFSGGLTVEF